MLIEKIEFILSFKEPQAHYVEIDMLLSGVQADKIDLKMPVWTPGSYLIREFARHVEQLSAIDTDNNSFVVNKIQKNTWRIEQPSAELKISYRVYGFEKSVRTNFIDDSHAFISSAATFLYVDGCMHLPATVTIQMPESWRKVSTGLTTHPELPYRYQAVDFDTLYDSPLEIGNQDTWQFEAAGVLHEFAMVGQATYDRERLSDDISKIILAETAIWGSNPNERYVFITHNYQSARGGLEHLNSTVLAASRDTYSSTLEYNNYLSLVAHEYFHLWHVKRLRPRTLGPFDYEKENYTRLLWIFEGFTAYYDNLITRRCGFRSETDYLAELSSDFNAVLNRPGHEIQSAGLASFDAWIKHYRPDENSPNTSISYYSKGAMLATMLDIYIIANTNGEQRLDTVLRAAYNKFYIVEDQGVNEAEFLQLAEDVTGLSLGKIFDAAHRTEELDYHAYFKLVGYLLVDQNSGINSPSIGATYSLQEGRTLVKSVERNSAAWEHGLNVDDEIIAVNGTRVGISGREIELRVQQSKIGDWISLLIARDGLIRELSLCLKASEKVSYKIERNPASTAEQQGLGTIWLSLDK
ncbi:MAG: M61 family metallopeptidase [Sphingobacterium sp.]